MGMVAVVLLLIVLAAAVRFFQKIATADGDFTLISRGPAKRELVEDKVVWITGASRGIGEVLAKQFAALGAKLILSARNVAELERVRSELVGKHAPAGVEILPLDLVSGERSLKAAVDKAEAFFSGAGVDYMIHNAAYEHPKSSSLVVTEEKLQATLDTNVLGTAILTQLLAPRMLKRGRGHFVVMSSAAGKVPAPGQAIYSASKHALNGYFHTFSSELHRKGIKVTVVCPGPINTLKYSRSTTPECDPEAEPVLLIMYAAQYMPAVTYWFMDKIGERRMEAISSKDKIYGWSLLFGEKKKAM